MENLSPEEMQKKIEELESAIASAEQEQVMGDDLGSPSANAELDPVCVRNPVWGLCSVKVTISSLRKLAILL